MYSFVLVIDQKCLKIALSKRVIISLLLIFTLNIFFIFFINQKLTKLDLTKIENTYIENKLLRTKTTMLSQTTQELKYKLFALRDNFENFKMIVGKREQQEDFIFLNDTFKSIELKKELMGNRITAYSLNLRDKPLITYYADEFDEKQKNIVEKKAQNSHKYLNEIVRNLSFNTEVEIFEIAKDEYIGMIGYLPVFNVSKEDARYHHLTAIELAQRYKEILEKELALLKDQKEFTGTPLRKKVDIGNFLSPNTNSSLLYTKKTIDEAEKLLTKENLEVANVYDKVISFKIKYVKTPSIHPLKRTLYITSPYGFRIHPITKKANFHAGIDFLAWHGTSVYSTASGRVVYAGWLGGYGNTVKIYHGDGLLTLYGHNSKLLVKRGQYIKKGQLIAKSGSSGMVAGAHLHYEIRKWNANLDPTTYLNKDIYSASKEW